MALGAVRQEMEGTKIRRVHKLSPLSPGFPQLDAQDAGHHVYVHSSPRLFGGIVDNFSIAGDKLRTMWTTRCTYTWITRWPTGINAAVVHRVWG